MPNGDGTRKGKKSLGLIGKTQLCTCIALFFINFFCRRLSRLQTSLLHVLWMKCRMCSQKILLPVCAPVRFVLHCHSFSPCWLLALHNFLPQLQKNSCCSRNEIRLFLFISRFSSFSVIHVSIDTMKTKSNKDSAFLSFCL